MEYALDFVDYPDDHTSMVVGSSVIKEVDVQIFRDD